MTTIHVLLNSMKIPCKRCGAHHKYWTKFCKVIDFTRSEWLPGEGENYKFMMIDHKGDYINLQKEKEKNG